MADFQETYGLNLWALCPPSQEETTPDVLRAAALAYQLHPSSRVRGAIEPEHSHGLVAQLLREIEHNQRVWHWANTKEAEKPDTEPERILLAGEEQAHEEAVERAQAAAVGLAEKMGLKL